MKYQEISPPPDLEDVIRFFWIAEADALPSESIAFRIVADGCPGIIYQKSNSSYSPDAETESSLPGLFLYGQTTRHGILRSSGKTYTIGVNFYPHALKTIFGFDADEAMDDIIDIDLIRSGLYERMCYAGETKKRLNLLSSFIRDQIEQHAYTDSAVLSCVLQIHKTRGNILMNKLHGDLQISERQFQRRFKQQVGITPKLFARIIRFQSSLIQVRSNKYQLLSDVAFDNGYADQSHFIRDFKEFAGLNPGTCGIRDVPFVCQHREWNMALT